MEEITALRIQGDRLLRSSDSQQAGIELLQKIIAQYPDEIYEVATIQDILGDYYYQKGDFENAGPYLQSVVDFYRKHKRIGVIRIADLMLAEIILLCKQTDRLEEAWQLIIQYPRLGGSLTEEHEQYYYNQLLAHVCYQSGKKKEAADYARKAIEIAQNIELDFMIGKPAAIEKYYQQLPDLQQIADYEPI